MTDLTGNSAPPPIAAIIDYATAASKTTLAVSGRLIPVLTFFTSDGAALCPLDDYGDPDMKEVYHMALRELLAVQKATAYVHAMEAWLSSSNTSEPDVLPEDDPDRKEAIVISAATITGEKQVTVIPFTRDENGEISFAEPRSIAYVMYGPLLELFDQSVMQ